MRSCSFAMLPVHRSRHQHLLRLPLGRRLRQLQLPLPHRLEPLVSLQVRRRALHPGRPQRQDHILRPGRGRQCLLDPKAKQEEIQKRKNAKPAFNAKTREPLQRRLVTAAAGAPRGSRNITHWSGYSLLSSCFPEFISCLGMSSRWGHRNQHVERVRYPDLCSFALAAP